eukprot:26720_1
MSVTWVIPLQQIYDEMLVIITNLLFGAFYCRHIDGDPPRNFHTFEPNYMPIYQVGSMCSSIKTFSKWVTQTAPEELLSCTSKTLMIYSQCQSVVRNQKQAKLFDDVEQNIYYLCNESAYIALKLLKIPPSKEAMRYFGYVQEFSPIPGSLILFSPTKSHIVFRNITNIYLDTTGLLISPTKFKYCMQSSTWYNFYMTTDSPFGGVTGMCLLDYSSTSKTSESMYHALSKFGCSYNKFWGFAIGPIVLEHKYFAHTDCDLATGNAVCQFGNQKPLKEYVLTIWECWFLGQLCAFMMILCWCWPHITGYVARNNKHYKHLPKPVQKKIKYLCLWMIKLIKLCLSITTIMVCINILFFYLNNEYMVIGEDIECRGVNQNDIKQELSKVEIKSDHGFQCSDRKRQQAQEAADASQSIIEIQQILCNEV